MQNTEERARYWIEVICNQCQFPFPEKLRQQFAHARLLDFCACGCNSFKVQIPLNTDIPAMTEPGHSGLVFEANFKILEEDTKTIEVLLFAGKSGHLDYVEIDCCSNSYPVPEEIRIQEAPFHVHASKSLNPI